MEEAIGDYRVDEDAEDFDSDVNDAVEFVQDRVGWLLFLMHSSPDCEVTHEIVPLPLNDDIVPLTVGMLWRGQLHRLV